MLFFFLILGAGMCVQRHLLTSGEDTLRGWNYLVLFRDIFFYASSKICGIAMTVKGFKSLLKTFKPLNAEV